MILILTADFPDKHSDINCFFNIVILFHILLITHQTFLYWESYCLNYYGMTQEFLKIFFFFCLIFPDLNFIVVEEFLLWYGTAPNEP